MTVSVPVTVEQWLANPAKCIADARRTAQAERADRWEVVIPSGPSLCVIKKGKA